MLHAESEKRMRFVKAESKLKDYINGTMTYQESIRKRSTSYAKMNQTAKPGKPVKIDPKQNFSIQQKSTLMKK
jgi:fructose-bisphosphate aldolase class 1